VTPPTREQSLDLQTAGVSALCIFSNNDAFQKQLVDAHAVESVLEAVRHHGSSLALKIRALVFMLNLANKTEQEAVLRIWNASGLALPALLAEAAEEKELESGMRDELRAVRDRLAQLLSQPPPSSPAACSSPVMPSTPTAS